MEGDRPVVTTAPTANQQQLLTNCRCCLKSTASCSRMHSDGYPLLTEAAAIDAAPPS